MMGTSLFILAVGIACTFVAATELPNKQWLTREDLQLAMAEIRLEHRAELDEIKAAFKAETDRMSNAFSKNIQSVRDALNDEREANQRNQVEIARLQNEVRRLGDRTQPRDDADEAKSREDTETDVTEHGIRNTEQMRSHNSERIRTRNAGNKRLVLGEGSLPVAFSVALHDSNHGEHLGVHQTIRFDKVITNLGNKFDTRLGVFTAPVSGWYAFSLTLMSRPNETQEFQVVNNGTYVFRCYSTGNEYNTASRTMVVHVQQGNEVWVETMNAYSQNAHAWDHTSFSGWLLYFAD